jgi:hypothetical protein
MNRLRRTTVVVATVFTLVGLNSATAVAVPPPSLVRPLDCLREFDESPHYARDGWARARVADVAGVFLGCGDEMSGVIHIAHPESRGHTHPIPPGAENSFLWCFERTIRLGRQRPDNDYPESRTRYEYAYNGDIGAPFPMAGASQRATAIVDNAGGFVWTFFASGPRSPQSNNWGGCVADIA